LYVAVVVVVAGGVVVIIIIIIIIAWRGVAWRDPVPCRALPCVCRALTLRRCALLNRPS